MILAQLTDTHVVERGEQRFIDNNAMLEKAVESLNAEDPAPDAVVGTGDLTDWARPAQFNELRRLLEPLAAQFLPLPGNHDNRDLMRESFPHTPWCDADHASWSTQIDGTTLIGLDTTQPDRHGGMFDDDREQWLRSELESSPGPVILALHHPPFDTGVSWMDDFGFARAGDLMTVVAEHSSTIIRVLCGHFHRPVVTTFGGVTTSICPATVHHVALDLAPGKGPALIVDPRGYQLHLVHGTTVVTHTRYIDRSERTFDPGWGSME